MYQPKTKKGQLALYNLNQNKKNKSFNKNETFIIREMI